MMMTYTIVLWSLLMLFLLITIDLLSAFIVRSSNNKPFVRTSSLKKYKLRKSIFVNNNYDGRLMGVEKALRTSTIHDNDNEDPSGIIPSTTTSSLQTSNNNDNNNNNNMIVQYELLSAILMPSTDCRVEQMSTTDLAYIGDVVYELFIRCRTVWPPKKTSNLQNEVVSIVRAENQAVLLNKIRNSIELTNTELQILSRGRNAQNTRKQHRNPAAYQDSTAFESLLGYLYITNTTRCAEILHWIDNNGLD